LRTASSCIQQLIKCEVPFWFHGYPPRINLAVRFCSPSNLEHDTHHALKLGLNKLGQHLLCEDLSEPIAFSSNSTGCGEILKFCVMGWSSTQTSATALKSAMQDGIVAKSMRSCGLGNAQAGRAASLIA
jgi:hypothetical protein